MVITLVFMVVTLWLLRQNVIEAAAEELGTRSDLNLAQEEETLDRINYRRWKGIMEFVGGMARSLLRNVKMFEAD